MVALLSHWSEDGRGPWDPFEKKGRMGTCSSGCGGRSSRSGPSLRTIAFLLKMTQPYAVAFMELLSFALLVLCLRWWGVNVQISSIEDRDRMSQDRVKDRNRVLRCVHAGVTGH
jgi:hypothetical protein